MNDYGINLRPPGAGGSANEPEWRILRAGKERGPFSRAELVELAAVGEIEATDLLRPTGGLWTKARDLSFLQFAFIQDVPVGILVEARTERRGRRPPQPRPKVAREDAIHGAPAKASPETVGTIGPAAWVMFGVGMVLFLVLSLLGNLAILRLLIWGVIFVTSAYFCFRSNERRGITIVAGIFLLAAGCDLASAIYGRYAFQSSAAQAAIAPPDDTLPGLNEDRPALPGFNSGKQDSANDAPLEAQSAAIVLHKDQPAAPAAEIVPHKDQPVALAVENDPSHRGGTAVDTPPLTPVELFSRSSAAVVKLVIEDRQGRAIGWGSGFLVSKGASKARENFAVERPGGRFSLLGTKGIQGEEKSLIATNYHVIEKAHTAHIVLADRTTLRVLGVAAMDQEADIAIIVIAGQIGAQPLELNRNDLPPVGTKVYAIGTPLGRYSNTLSDGLISGHRQIGAHTEIQTTAPTSPGSSGGPLLGPSGKVVGVTTASNPRGQNLNLAVPASQVVKLLMQWEGEGNLTQFPLPQDAISFFKSGNGWMEKRHYDNAIKDYNEAILLIPNYAWAFHNRGRAWGYKKVHVQAGRDYTLAIKLDPKNAVFFNSRGNAWRNMNDSPNAILDFTQAIRLDPKYAVAFNNRGNAWQFLGDYQRAKLDYDEAHRLDPVAFPR